VILEISQTDYNGFRRKINTGEFQLFNWGWNADYPDPENFMFLLYGPNGKVKYQGENAVNYANPEFDKLFEKMKNMKNSAERLAIIRKMIAIVQHDSPWIFGFYPKRYKLFHSWLRNVKYNPMALNTLKYYNIDIEVRNAYRKLFNREP